MRTTIAPTIFQAGMKTNVLPAHAEAIVNFRIHPRDSVQAVVNHVHSVIGNPDVEIQKLGTAREASFVSDLDEGSYQDLKQSIWKRSGRFRWHRPCSSRPPIPASSTI